MENIRPSCCIGTFYPKDKNELQHLLENFKTHLKNDYNCISRAVIVPHAGLIYSGQLALEGIKYLNQNTKNIFIFAPAHKVGFEGIALSSFEKWETPLGQISLNKNIEKELITKYDAKYFDDAFMQEHSIEVQLPILQTLFKDINIIPVLYSKTNFRVISDIINDFYSDDKNSFIISSDLSHFFEMKKAMSIDSITAQMIENKITDKFTYEQACGAIGICALIEFAKKHQYSLIRVGMMNSGHITGEQKTVVGYGAWMLYENTKNNFIKKYCSNFVLDLCKRAIHAKLFNKSEINIPNYPSVLDEIGSSFVTLKKEGALRGCIGSIISNRRLIEDIIINAQNAAFSDPRFNPVQKDEINDISVAISILSTPVKMNFYDENDLLNKIHQGTDGIIIQDGNKRAVYLPSVWEELPDKIQFLNTLKMKAGMAPTHFSKTFEAYKFSSEYIE